MADEMKELRGAVFDLIPDGVSVVALDEIEVDDMAPKTRNVKDEDSNKQHRVDDERFGGLVYKLPGVAVRDCRRKRIRDKVSVFVRQRPSAAIPEMTQLRLTGRVLLSPYAVDDLGFTIVADGVESCISSSRCFVFSHVFFSGLGSCMHFPYFSGCAEVFLPNMRASLTRRLWPVNSRSRPWCTMRSMIAAASLSSAKTVPHLLNSMFVVNMMLRLS